MTKSRTSKPRSARLLPAALGLLLMLALPASSCGSHHASSDPTGGETHFLTHCEANSVCGNALGCTCGVCTVGCTGDSDCAGLPGAACFTASTSGDGASCESGVIGRCDVRCVTDVDCHKVSPSHRCESGFCRAGEPGAGVGGAGGSDGVGAGGACARGDVSGNQVVFLGDTFIAATHQVTAEVEQLARDAGSLPVGQRYRDESTMTTNTLALTGHGIL